MRPILNPFTGQLQMINQDGTPGAGIVVKGAYNASTDYAVGDSVDYLGSSYVMYVDAVAGTLPTDTTYWQVLANKGATGDPGSSITGPPGPPGGDGPNNITTSTTTNLTGFIKGNGSVASADNSTYSTDIHSNITALNAVSNTNTGDQTSSNFDVKDLTDSTNLRTSWTGKQSALSEGTDYLNKTHLDAAYAPVSVVNYTLPTAAAAVLGGVKIGDRLSVNTGILSADVQTTDISGKVDKIAGKGLSTNDYTTAEQSKLSGIEASANNYTHPATHSADIITDGTTNKAYTVTEQSKLSGIATGANVGVVPNAGITAGTKTKITYDIKGLITSGADATCDDIADGTNNHLVTTAQKTVIGNTSNTNSGDNATNTQYSGLTQYTDELAQDAVGGMVDTTLTYTDLTPLLKVTNPITPQITGFTISAGTTPKTLTVADTASVTGTNTGDNAVNSNYSSLVSNANHSGDVTGATALTIANKVTMTATAPVTVSGSPTVIAGGAVAIAIPAATASVNGYATSTQITKLDGIAAGAEVNVNADWNSVTGDSQISNKPTLGTAAAKNIPDTGDASATEVVYGSDTRLTNARTPSSHNQAWSTINSGVPTTLSGYGITDALGLHGTADAVSGITITAGASISNANTGDQTLPVKATGAEINTGTDDAKFVTAKAIIDSKVSITDHTETLTNKTLTSPKINEDVALTATATELNNIFGAWVDYNLTWTASTTNPVISNGTIRGRYFQRGKTITFTWVITMGSTTTYGTGFWKISLPVEPIATGITPEMYCLAKCNDVTPGSTQFLSWGYAIDANNLVFDITTGARGNITLAVPFTWASGDTFQGYAVYEIA